MLGLLIQEQNKEFVKVQENMKQLAQLFESVQSSVSTLAKNQQHIQKLLANTSLADAIVPSLAFSNNSITNSISNNNNNNTSFPWNQSPLHRSEDDSMDENNPDDL